MRNSLRDNAENSSALSFPYFELCMILYNLRIGSVLSPQYGHQNFKLPKKHFNEVVLIQ